MNGKANRTVQGFLLAGGRRRLEGRGRGGMGVRSGWGLLKQGQLLICFPILDKTKNSFQKPESAGCLILIVVTSGDLSPFQTISWAF